MNAAADDWRRMGQEQCLPSGTILARTRYRACRPGWDHDHCVFCCVKFVAAEVASLYRDVLTEGYTTTDAHPSGAGYYWVCPTCVGDFADEFRWQVREI